MAEVTERLDEAKKDAVAKHKSNPNPLRGLQFLGASMLFGVGVGAMIPEVYRYTVSLLSIFVAFLFLGFATGFLKVGSPKKLKKDTDAVSPVIAVILMVAITVVLASTVFVLLTDISGNVAKPAPSLGLSADDADDSIMVSSVSRNDLTWGEFSVTGCSAPNDNDTVRAGDKLTGCSGEVTIIHEPSNVLVWRGRFT